MGSSLPGLTITCSLGSYTISGFATKMVSLRKRLAKTSVPVATVGTPALAAPKPRIFRNRWNTAEHAREAVFIRFPPI
jgi:hypothetical protein